MKLDGNQKSLLAKEIELLSEKILNSEDFFTANFYFSAAYGIFDKILKMDYNKMILLTEETLQMAYLRTSALVQDEQLQKMIGLERIMETMKNIGKRIGELGDEFKKGTDYTNTLADITELAYLLTGPGIYQKNMDLI
jgi:hypothetical protein